MKTKLFEATYANGITEILEATVDNARNIEIHVIRRGEGVNESLIYTLMPAEQIELIAHLAKNLAGEL